MGGWGGTKNICEKHEAVRRNCRWRGALGCKLLTHLHVIRERGSRNNRDKVPRTNRPILRGGGTAKKKAVKRGKSPLKD